MSAMELPNDGKLVQKMNGYMSPTKRNVIGRYYYDKSSLIMNEKVYPRNDHFSTCVRKR